MFKIGEYVLYKGTGVCKIEDITEREFGSKCREYYILKPVEQEGSTIYVPADSEKSVSKMRQVLSEVEIKNIIKEMPKEGKEWIDDANERKLLFKEAINSGEPRRLVHTIRSIHQHKLDLLQRGKKLNMSDTQFMKEAERLLYDEFALGLHMKPDEVLSFIVTQIEK